MGKTKIVWPWPNLYTWNPVVGCPRDCQADGKSFCYARKIATRFKMVPDFSKPVFFPERLKQRFKAGSNVFVGSMSDIEYWGIDDTASILRYCALHSSTHFYFLTKNPLVYHIYSFPENCHLGLTMTLTQTEQEQEKMADTMAEYPRTFLSIEPLLGELLIRPSKLKRFEKIIVGAMTGPGAIKPLPEWVESIERLKLENVFWKPSMKGLV